LTSDPAFSQNMEEKNDKTCYGAGNG